MGKLKRREETNEVIGIAAWNLILRFFQPVEALQVKRGGAQLGRLSSAFPVHVYPK